LSDSRSLDPEQSTADAFSGSSFLPSECKKQNNTLAKPIEPSEEGEAGAAPATAGDAPREEVGVLTATLGCYHHHAFE